MIGFLRGRLLSVETDVALVETGGVGYEVHASGLTLGDLLSRVGQDIVLWIHTHVREDALQLFGFASKAEKDLFLSLLKVNGVGPKMALGILSGARVNELVEIIEGGNAKALSGLPRVGKKTAEQIILSLQGKLVRVEAQRSSLSDPQRQIQSALLNLGFKGPRVDEFIASLPSEVGLEEGVRRGLSALSSAV